MIPSITSQIEDLGSSLPNFVNYLKDNVDAFFNHLNNVGDYDFTDIKISIYDEINHLSDSIGVDIPSRVIGIIKSIVSGGVNWIIYWALYVI